jgi:DNA invertase Pin-like site-specific DNA recombinase
MPDDIAFSYVRYSDPSQEKGDTLRRQREARETWLKAHPQVKLDTSLRLTDAGRSAYKRKNWDTYALAEFVKHIKSGRVKPGSYLLVENLDRLSREDAGEATELFLSIVNRGIIVVQLMPVVMEFRRPVNIQSLMFAIVELSRGHSESAAKSNRVGAAWQQRRTKACTGGVLTRRLPAWVEERDGKLHLIPDRADVVRRVFALAGAGFGLYTILHRLTDEGMSPFGTRLTPEEADSHRRARDEAGEPLTAEEEAALGSLGRWASRKSRVDEGGRVRVWVPSRWSVSYLHKILKDRRAVGDFQPMRDGKPDGEPIADYFPRCVDDNAWWRARLGAKERHRRPGRVGSEVNVFTGLLKSARDRHGDGWESYVTATETGRGNPYRVIRSNAMRSARPKSKPPKQDDPAKGKRDAKPHGYSFPLAVFEAAVLGQLKELDPREVLEADDSADEVASLRGEKARVEARISELEAELLVGDVTLARVVRTLEGRLKELGERLAEAERKASHPASAAWGEARSILEALDTAADPRDLRLRLRSALRRLINSIYLLVVPRGRDRLLAAQVWFAGGDRCRSYLVLHRPAKANASARQEGMWWVRSLATVAAPADLDLRRHEDVEELEAALAAADLAAVEPAAPSPVRRARRPGARSRQRPRPK